MCHKTEDFDFTKTYFGGVDGDGDDDGDGRIASHLQPPNSITPSYESRPFGSLQNHLCTTHASHDFNVATLVEL